MQLAIGFSLGLLISLLAWHTGTLSQSGAIAATLSGGLVFGLGGFAWAVLLLVFFISSSLLSRLPRSGKRSVGEKYAKGSQRDWGQVLANGGLGALLVITFTLSPVKTWLWIAYAGAMAAVNADTWSTELGILSPALPRLITSGKAVEPGTSGAVSTLGSLAALGGSVLIALCAALLTTWRGLDQTGFFLLIAIVTIGGLSGAFFDSFLGATVQAIYYCPSCRKETERHPNHVCGTETNHMRGWRWLNNDMVNFACSFAGASVAAGLFLILN